MAVLEVEDREKLAQEMQALFQLPKRVEQATQDEELPLVPTSTTMSSLKELLASAQLHLCLLGHLRNATRKDGGIHPSPSVMGAEKAALPAGGRPHLLA